ncbi:MAG: tRNA (adenosine(37)-N6)-dimethylallyltransferase MiaA [Patescibacteria group bacterium]
MNTNKKQKIIFITGPTGSGKSELSLWLAKKLNAEIINADSRQVYKKLDVGSGKISKLEQKQINHHLLSIASPKINFSLGRWLKLVALSIKEILKKEKIIIFCGGTNLYLKAFKEGWILPEIKPDYKFRKKLEKRTVEKLFEILIKVDPERAKTIESKNKRRLIRAIEITKAIGKVPKLKKEPLYEFLIIAIDVNWKVLELKIEKRFLERLTGIIKEIKKLRKSGLSFKRIMSFGLSYYWLGAYIEEKNETHRFHSKRFSSQQVYKKSFSISLNEAKEKACKSEINFAKRQTRELKKLPYIEWVKSKNQALDICKKFLQK